MLFSVWVAVDVLFLGVSGGIAQSTYDAMVRYRVFAPVHDPRIVIVDIDESALARMAPEFGRWPWPRDTLATVLDHIESQGPAAVVWDVVFSDADKLSPGGDAAFDAAAHRSAHSHFSVVRLPTKNDDKSELTHQHLSNLWIQAPTASSAATVALVPPVLPSIAKRPLGYNNGYVDTDGILRRYRYFERLSDGSIIQSLPMSVVQALDPALHRQWLSRFSAKAASTEHSEASDVLINWRKSAETYQRVNFADVFAQADGGEVRATVPSMAGKIVIIGATAPSLHDTHPTPLSGTQAGVESLATGIDNALHQRWIWELPKWAGALIAILMCAGIALWSYRRSVSATAGPMVGVPALLLGIGYISLHTELVFIDLHLSAGLALLFLAVLKFWYFLRKKHWCGDLPAETPDPAVWSWESSEPWSDDQLDRLMMALQQSAPDCRLLLLDLSPSDRLWVSWRPFSSCLALIGPADTLRQAQALLLGSVRDAHVRCAEIEPLESETPAQDVHRRMTQLALQGWSSLQRTVTHSTKHKL
jgi:adenylate cyclase